MGGPPTAWPQNAGSPKRHNHSPISSASERGHVWTPSAPLTFPLTGLLSGLTDTIERMYSLDNAERVPKSLDTMEPGHEMACVLSAINVDECGRYDCIRVLKAHERMRSFHSAQLYQAMTAVVDAVDSDDMAGGYVEEAAAAGVAAALKWTRRTADNEMGFAIDLRHRLPTVG